MGTSVWYLLLLLVLANGEIFDNISKSFYDKSDSSSPKSNQRLTATEEYVLYLTPDQAQALQATGAIVRPLPQLGTSFQQQRFQQNIRDHTVPREQNISTSKRFQLDKNLKEFYEENNGKQLNTGLFLQLQRKYKYSNKPRQEYVSLYVPKKNYRTNSHSMEYVSSYLPNYEVEILKMKPYNAQPLPGYYFVDSQTHPKVETYSHSETKANLRQVEIQKPDEIIKSIRLQNSENFPKFEPIQRYEDVQKHVRIHRPSNSQSPVEIQRNTEIRSLTQQREKSQKHLNIQNKEIQTPLDVQKPEEIRGPLEISEHDELQSSLLGLPREVEIKENENIQRPEEIHSVIQIPTRSLTIERMRNQQPIKLDKTSVTHTGPVTFDDKPRNQVNDQESEKDKTSLQLTTPSLKEKEENISPSTVVQHDKLSENEQKDLINNERVIQMKLQQLKESGTHNEEKYAIEVENLKKNLGKQNILAQKLATQSISKKPQGLVKEELDLKRRHPIELAHNLDPSPVIIPRPYPIAWGIERPIPVPVLQPEKVENVPIDVDISNPGSKTFYTTVPTPYLAQEITTGEVKHDIPFAYHIHEPENLAILRDIWEH